MGVVKRAVMTAAMDAYFFVVGNSQAANVSGGRDSFVLSLGNYAGGVSAGENAFLISESGVTATLNAGLDSLVYAYGPVGGSYSTGRDINVVSYDSIGASVNAGRDLVSLQAGGDINGVVFANRNIGGDGLTPSAFSNGAIFAHGAIGTTGFSATAGDSIRSVGAVGPISGNFSAVNTLTSIYSGQGITVTTSSSNTPVLTAYDSDFANIPPPVVPPLSSSGILTGMAAAKAEVLGDIALLFNSFAETHTALTNSRTEEANAIQEAASNHQATIVTIISEAANAVSQAQAGFLEALDDKAIALYAELDATFAAIDGVLDGVISGHHQAVVANTKSFNEATAIKSQALAAVSKADTAMAELHTQRLNEAGILYVIFDAKFSEDKQHLERVVSSITADQEVDPHTISLIYAQTPPKLPALEYLPPPNRNAPATAYTRGALMAELAFETKEQRENYRRECREHAKWSQQVLEEFAETLPGFGTLLDLRKALIGTDLQGEEISKGERFLAGLSALGGLTGFSSTFDELTDTGRGMWKANLMGDAANNFQTLNKAQRAQAAARRGVDIACNKCFTPDTLTHRISTHDESQAGHFDAAFITLVTGAGLIVLWDLQTRIHQESQRRRARHRHRLSPAFDDPHCRWILAE